MRGINWNTTEIQSLFASVLKHGTGRWAEVSEDVGRSAEACRCQWKTVKDKVPVSASKNPWLGKPTFESQVFPDVEVPLEFDLEREGSSVSSSDESTPTATPSDPSSASEGAQIVRLNQQIVGKDLHIKSLKGELTLQRKHGSKYAELGAAIREVVVPLPLSPRQVLGPRSTPRHRHKRTAVLCLSDWHANEVVRAEVTEGIGDYNLDICARCIWQLLQKTLHWIDDLQNLWEIDKLVVVVAGDMFSGLIHEELAETNEVSTGLAVPWTAALLSEFLWRVSEAVNLEVVDVPGNHGRFKKKMDTKRPEDSWDWFVYDGAHARLSEYIADGQIVWKRTPTWFSSFIAQERLYVVAHGHQVRGALGIPYYGFRRFMANLVKKQVIKDRQLLELDGKISTIGIDKVIIGHFHRVGKMEDVILNGSPKGVDEFSTATALEPTDRAQVGFLVDKNFGVCGEETFILNTFPDDHGFALPLVS